MNPSDNKVVKLSQALKLGDQCLATGKIQEAHDIYLKVLKAAPKNAKAKKGLRKAVNLLKRADDTSTSVDGKDIQLLINLYRENQFSEVIQRANKLKINHPDAAQLLNILGAAYTAVGNVEAAIHELQNSISVDRNSPHTYANLGNAFKLKQDWESAIECFDAAIALKPDFPEAHNNLGTLYHKLGNYKQAEPHLKTAI